MSFKTDFKTALEMGIPPDQLHFMEGWTREWYRPTWKGAGGVPVALVLHHTAGASTASTATGAPGNQHGANDGVIKYVNRHPLYKQPASQFTLDRDGCLFVNAYLPCYHAGLGDFAGTGWEALGVGRNQGNNYMMGVECVSRGLEPDFTQAMKKTLARLAVAMKVACDWPDTSTLRLPRHRDYAPSRKIDIQHSNNEVQEWIRLETEAWDGKVPDIEGIYNAEKDPNLRNPAAWRLAARLFDLGYGDYPQPKTKQGYPRKAMILYNKEFGPNMEDKSKYGPKAHERIFGL